MSELTLGLEKNILSKESIRKHDLLRISNFLLKNGLHLESENLDYSVYYEVNSEIIAHGALEGNILKYFAVDPNYQGYNLINSIASELIAEAFRQNIFKLFVFTKPVNLNIFKSIGFYEIIQTDKIAFLENDRNSFPNFLKTINKETIENKYYLNNEDNIKNIASIVMNCNPFTLGHRFLIETASKNNDLVHLFILQEDLSSFPFKTRFKLIEDGIQDLKNVVLHKTSDYLISQATFPTYFLKADEVDLVEEQSIIDVKLFLKIAKSLNINKRYVGEEPLDITTSTYNKVIHSILSENNIEVVEVKRLETQNGEIISASKVRSLLKLSKIVELDQFIPSSTKKFLNSEEGQKLISKLKESK